MMEITRKLAKNIKDFDFKNIPSEVVDKAKYFTLDFLGVTLRGSQEESSKSIYQFIKKISSTDKGGRIIGTEFRAPFQYSALANGTAGHALELDDVNNESSLHPGVAILPAAISACEMTGTGGKEFIEGVVLGYETMIRIGKALNPKELYSRGFHPTGICGTFGAVAAVSKILELEEEQIVNSFGIAGSMASGSMEFLSDGAWSKRMHPGWAAHSGIIAVLLAKEGFTGPKTIFEGKHGILNSYSGQTDYKVITEKLGSEYEILKTSIKPHSCCRYMQPPIDAILKIMSENQIDPDKIEKITIAVLQAGFSLIASPIEEKQNPKTVYEAKFSMPFGASVAILFGKATLDEFCEKNLTLPEIKKLMKKVECVTDPDLEKLYPSRWTAKAEIRMDSGQTFSSYIEYPKGDPENPLTWDELIEKFNDLSKNIYSRNKLEELIDQVRKLDEIQNLNNMNF